MSLPVSCYLIEHPKGKILIDAAYLSHMDFDHTSGLALVKNAKKIMAAEKTIPGFTVDHNLAKRSLNWICQCANDPDCLLVAPNHDPEIAEQSITL